MKKVLFWNAPAALLIQVGIQALFCAILNIMESYEWCLVSNGGCMAYAYAKKLPLSNYLKEYSLT